MSGEWRDNVEDFKKTFISTILKPGIIIALILFGVSLYFNRRVVSPEQSDIEVLSWYIPKHGISLFCRSLGHLSLVLQFLFISKRWFLRFVWIFLAFQSSVFALVQGVELSRDSFKLGKVNSEGQSPLMRAAYTGDITRVQELILNGAEINAANQAGDTALHYACGATQSAGAPPAHVSSSVVGYLLDHGAKADAKNIFGLTPLINAVSNSSIEGVRLLISHGANVNEATNYGITALSEARKRNEPEIESELLKAGAKPRE